MSVSRTSPRRVWLWLLCLLPGAAIGTAALLVGLGFVFNASGETEPVSSDERALLLDIDHASQFMPGFKPHANYESVTKTRYVDGSFELEYQYDEPEESGAPYLVYSLTVENNDADARTTYTSTWGGTRAALYFGEGDIVVEEAELLRWGDRSRFAILKADGGAFGNVFVGQQGDTVVYLLLAGLYFDDAQSVDRLLTPYLERLP